MPARRPYLPPFTVILGLLGSGSSSAPIADGQTVTIPFGVLRLLLRGALAAMPFDEERYLHHNPDVASAVFRGEIKSGHEHYLVDGYFEGRDGVDDAFVEAAYLELNPDVASAVAAGIFASGHEHYVAKGVFELRGPNAAAEAEMALWRAYGWTMAGAPETTDAEPAGAARNG
jgi:hypothetical protein